MGKGSKSSAQPRVPVPRREPAEVTERVVEKNKVRRYTGGREGSTGVSA